MKSETVWFSFLPARARDQTYNIQNLAPVFVGCAVRSDENHTKYGLPALFTDRPLAIRYLTTTRVNTVYFSLP